MTGYASYHDLRDASVFITGGGSGIGEAITAGFLAPGRESRLCRSRTPRPSWPSIAAAHAPRAAALPCDVTDTAALKAALAQAAEAHGPIRVLVNLAAYDHRHDTLEVTEEYWRTGACRGTCDHYSSPPRR